jgi:MoaA/NifB/PqqE/SkfB family radical SAM enzyme
LRSLEITKQCPLKCPGCYAYQPDHLDRGVGLHQLSDLRGKALIEGVLDLVRRLRPIHISIVGGEPLVRFRELSELLPELDRLGVEVQLVTSAVRPIPAEWSRIGCLHLVVSIDGLQPEHDKRRAPATYARILENIEGHRIIVHCTVTRQMASQPGHLEEFARYWSSRGEVYKIWFSLYTPQQGDESEERLRAEDRVSVVAELRRIRGLYPKLYMPDVVLAGYARPPHSPDECMFARLTECVSADLTTRISPCQFGGNPVCSECGCMASAGMASIGNYRLASLVPVSRVFAASQAIGQRIAARWRAVDQEAPCDAEAPRTAQVS